MEDRTKKTELTEVEKKGKKKSRAKTKTKTGNTEERGKERGKRSIVGKKKTRRERKRERENERKRERERPSLSLWWGQRQLLPLHYQASEPARLFMYIELSHYGRDRRTTE